MEYQVGEERNYEYIDYGKGQGNKLTPSWH